MTTILVIEDHKVVRENIIELLVDEGYDAVSASDGITGLELVKTKKPDFIICDIHMPGLDGYEVLEAIKNDEEISHIPLMFLSAFAEKSQVELGLARGAIGYLTKPFEPEDLFAIVKQTLKKSDSFP